MTRLLLVGGGRMGEALLGGLLEAGWATVDELAVVEPSDERAAQLRGRFPGLRVEATPCEADGAILATKPAVTAAVAAAVAAAGVQRVLSIAAGVTLATLQDALGAGCAVIRAMPNTAVLVGAGATAIAGGPHASPDDLDWAEALLATVGVVVRLGEDKLDAVTGLSGSGPAYLFLVAEALIEAGVLNGLDRTTSETLAAQTLLGSARLLTETDDSAAALRAAVTSPGGTTAAGLRALEQAGVRAAFLEAVTAATERSRQLG
jgi:pyrroline-5-carboxylate reductase